MKQRERGNKAVQLLGVAAFAVVLVAAIMNYPLVDGTLRRFVKRTISFSQMTGEISEAYRSDQLWEKDACITWNGLIARVTGRRVYNEVTLMSNGMITSEASLNNRIRGWESTAEKLRTLNQFLKELDIPFLYVQEPHKNTLQGEMLPRGTYIVSNNTVERMMEELTADGVETLDLIPVIAGSEEDINTYFYRTDHHWNADGAFKAYGCIVDEMERLLGEPLDKSTLNHDLWERHVLQNWWLGSRGRRVGPWYAGTDDLMWDTPLFETAYSLAVPSRNDFIYGDYSQVVIYEKFIKEKDLLHQNAHQLYFGGDRPLMQLRNAGAANQKKVLVMKDSYARPVMAYMSTAFSELDVLDPRYYEASSIAQYIEWTKPDIVLIMCNSGLALSDEFMANFGCEAQTAWREAHPLREAVMNAELAVVPAAENKKKNTEVLMDDLQPGMVYHVSIQNVRVTEGETDSFSLVLYDRMKKEVFWSSIFDIEYGQSQGGYTWTVQIPEGEGAYQLLACPGTYQRLAGTGLELAGIRIEVEK